MSTQRYSTSQTNIRSLKTHILPWLIDSKGGDYTTRQIGVGKHGMQLGEREAKWMNPKAGQWRSSHRAGWRTLIG